MDRMQGFMGNIEPELVERRLKKEKAEMKEKGLKYLTKEEALRK